jgi:hypothetical protein
MEKVGVVYAITNKLSGKVYFGETTRSGDTRINEHRLALSKGEERNKSLQKDYIKVGDDGFIYEVLFETKDHKLCELVLIELFSRIGLGYEQRQGDGIQKLRNKELIIPIEVYDQIDSCISRNYNEGNYLCKLQVELRDIKENGFECKTDTIYNRDFKKNFLVRYNNATRRVDEVRFKKAAKFEKQLQKDLYDFSFAEAEKILYSLNAKSLRSMQNHISRLSKYLEFAIQQGYSVNQINYFKGKGKKENASKYLNSKAKKKKED